jgi:hypothetical protein
MAYTSGRLFAGQVTGITTASSAVSTTEHNCREVIIQSSPDNTTDMFIGDVSSQYLVISPGQSITIPIVSLSLIYVRMESGTGILNYLTRD